MAKLLVIFGATGQQGGSVLNFVLNDPELSKEYTIRAITRDITSAKAEALKNKSVEVVTADTTDPSSLSAALKGAHTVFFLTAPTLGPNAKQHEITQGHAVADVAVSEGVQYLIFSTLPHVERVSGGKYTKVSGFDAKAEVEEYIRTLPIKSAFFAPGSFMQNFHSMTVPQPSWKKDGTYMIARPMSPQTQLPLIDTAGNTGKYVGAILAEPDKYEGKVFCAATALYTMEEMAEIIGKVSAKTVVYQQVPEEQFRQFLPQNGFADILIEMMLYQQDFGYYGPGTKEKVAWAVENARGKVNTFEEYLKENPLSFS
jgi:uncharacterized protein YbjT (DUF2867 family)